MFFKTLRTSQETKKSDPIKKDKIVPSQILFKEVMAKHKVQQLPKKQSSIFDLASKKHKKTQSLQHQNNSSQNIHNHPNQEQIKKDIHIQTENHSSIMEVKSLSLDMQTLLDKMANYIKIEAENGVSMTTISVDSNDENSIFNGSEIHIEHYDTAPHAFNIQLTGNPQAIETFSKHFTLLQTSLVERLEHFHITLLPPIIGEKHNRYAMRKKEGKKNKRIENVLKD